MLASISLRPYKKMNGGIMSLLLETTPNPMMWTGCLVFIQINMLSYRHPNTMKSLYGSFQHESQAVQHVVTKFLEKWFVSWCCFLICSIVDKTWNKAHAWNWFKMVTIYPSPPASDRNHLLKSWYYSMYSIFIVLKTTFQPIYSSGISRCMLYPIFRI